VPPLILPWASTLLSAARSRRPAADLRV